MDALAETAFVAAETKKEEKNKKREERIKAVEEERKRKKDEEEKKRREFLLKQAVALRNHQFGHNNINKQLAVPKAHVKAAQTPLPVASAKTTVHPTLVAWAKVVPNTIADASISRQSPTPVKPAAPLPAVTSTDASKINHYQHQPRPPATGSKGFYVGQIFVRRPTNNPCKETRAIVTAAETQATTVVLKTQEGVNTMTYATALLKKDADAQKKEIYNNAAVVPKITTVTTQTNQPAAAKEKVVIPLKKTTSSVSSERSYHSGTTNNGPDHKYYGNGIRVTNGNGSGQNYYGNGRVTNGWGHGSGQKYYGNERRFTNGGGNGSGQRYYGNYGRVTNGVGHENQKKQARTKPVTDAEGWQVVDYRSGRRDERV